MCLRASGSTTAIWLSIGARLPSLSLVVLLLLGGVGQAARAQETVIPSAASPAWGEYPALVEEVRIGDLMGPEQYTFGDVSDVAVVGGDVLWVGDYQLGAIRRYDSEGRYIDQVGRQGEGPGEFRYPTSIRELSDGTVAVWDAGLVRITLFDAGGEYLGSFRPPTWGADAFMTGPDDNLVLWTRTSFMSRDEAANLRRRGADGGDDGPDPELLRRLGIDGTDPEWYWLVLTPEGEVLDSVFQEPPRGKDHLWGRWSAVAWSPRGYPVVARGEEDRYRIALKLVESVREVVRLIEPVPYQTGEREEHERLAALAEERGGSGGTVLETKPPFKRLWLDEAGRMWVTLHAPGRLDSERPGEMGIGEPAEDGRAWSEPVLVEVLTPDGEYLGRLEFPNRETVLEVASGEHVWVVETGEYDEEYVVRYRIERWVNDTSPPPPP